MKLQSKIKIYTKLNFNWDENQAYLPFQLFEILILILIKKKEIITYKMILKHNSLNELNYILILKLILSLFSFLVFFTLFNFFLIFGNVLNYILKSKRSSIKLF